MLEKITQRRRLWRRTRPARPPRPASGISRPPGRKERKKLCISIAESRLLPAVVAALTHDLLGVLLHGVVEGELRVDVLRPERKDGSVFRHPLCRLGLVHVSVLVPLGEGRGGKEEKRGEEEELGGRHGHQKNSSVF